MRYQITAKHWFPYFLHSTGSCRKKCFDSSYSGLEGCWCDVGCKDRGDCCWDFEDTCVEPSMYSENKFIRMLVVLSLMYVQMPTSTPCVLVCYGCHRHYHKMDSLIKQQNSLSQLWRLEIQDLDVCRVGFF